MTSNEIQRADEESAAARAETSRAEASAPLEAAPADEAAPAAEAAAADEAAPVDSVPAAEAEPAAEAARADEEAKATQAPASIPPARLESPATPFSSLAPAIELTDEWIPRSTFWSTRPNRAWMLVGGSAIVIAFLVGALTGRAVQQERSPEFAAPAPLPRSEAPATVSALAASPALPLLPSSAPPSVVPVPATRALPVFNAKAAKAAIDGIAPRLKACRFAGDPVGSASVMVTFAPAGRVSSASVTTAGYAGTRTGNCIAERLREVRIPEFTGAAVTVKRSVTVR